MRKSILFALLLMAAVLISACADSGNDNNTPPPAQTYDVTGKIDYAGKTADTIIKKADSPATVLIVYNNALNTAPNSINISTSIRGLASVITDKLNNEVEITDSTAIAVMQVEIDTANNAVTTEDNKLPQEPAAPDNSTNTPLEKVTEMLAGAEIKNSAENSINLNKHLYPELNYKDSQIYELGIKYYAFGAFTTAPFALK